MKDIIICRCSDVSRDEIRDLINQGYTSFDEIKRILRVGMGPCQGRTCEQLVLKEISAITGKSLEELTKPTFRQPSVGVKIKDIASGGDDDEK